MLFSVFLSFVSHAQQQNLNSEVQKNRTKKQEDLGQITRPVYADKRGFEYYQFDTNIRALWDAREYCESKGMRLPTLNELKVLASELAEDPLRSSAWFKGVPHDVSILRTWAYDVTNDGTSAFYLFVDEVGGDIVFGENDGSMNLGFITRCFKSVIQEK